MKLTLRFLSATLLVLATYIPAVQAQANLTFSGGNGTPLTITLQQSVTYTIITAQCEPVYSPYFFFKSTGNYFPVGEHVSGTITYFINGGTARQIIGAGSGTSGFATSPNDTYLFGSLPGAPIGSTVVLSAGTLTTRNNFNGVPPINGSFTTFMTNNLGFKCSNNGIAVTPTAASVSISGRILTNSKRGLSNALVHLTNLEGNTRTARTNSFGYYRFEDIQVGQAVTVTVTSKRFRFAPQLLNINEEMTQLNFLAEQ
jgi:hypothetical protein